MSLIPLGKTQHMKGELSRPVFRTDITPLLKIVLAQQAQAPKPQPEERDTIEQEPVQMDGAPQNPAQPNKVPTPPPGAQPSQGMGAQPPAQLDAAQGQPQKNPEEEKKEARAKILKLRESVRQFLNEHGLSFDLKTTSDVLTATVSILPHVQAEDDGKFYPADQVMSPIVDKMFQMGFDVSEPTPAQEHRRVIDPNAKPVQYIFTYSAQKESQKQEQHGAYKIPRAPQGGTPVQHQRPQSQMGQVPQQKAASSFNTLPELLAARKDELVDTLVKILNRQ